MQTKFKIMSSIVIFTLIFNLVFPSYLHAHTLSTSSHFKDVPAHTRVSNLNNFKHLLELAVNNLQSEITLIVPDGDINTYSSIASQLTGISSYHLSLTKTSSTNKLIVSLKYKQAYRLTQALQNEKAHTRLTASDLSLLDVAQSIIIQIISPTMSDYEKELAIHDYIIKTTSYDYDRLSNGTIPDRSYTAAGVLINKIGVCEGYSEATKLLLNLVGIECEIVTGLTENNVPHAWNIVKIDGAWYMLDTTYDDPITFDNNGNRVETLSYDYFNVTSNVLMKDHSWETNKWPLAYSTKYNYYIYSNRLINNYSEFKTYVINELKAGSKEITCYIKNYTATYDLSFIFNYYNGKIKYLAPSSTSGSFKIILS